jgi:hypothetical protein
LFRKILHEPCDHMECRWQSDLTCFRKCYFELSATYIHGVRNYIRARKTDGILKQNFCKIVRPLALAKLEQKDSCDKMWLVPPPPHRSRYFGRKIPNPRHNRAPDSLTSLRSHINSKALSFTLTHTYSGCCKTWQICKHKFGIWDFLGSKDIRWDSLSEFIISWHLVLRMNCTHVRFNFNSSVTIESCYPAVRCYQSLKEACCSSLDGQSLESLVMIVTSICD